MKHDSDESMRAKAAQTLGNCVHYRERSVPLLRAALKDGALVVRVRAAGALGRLHSAGDGEVRLLRTALADAEAQNDSLLLCWILEEIGNLGRAGKVVVPDLLPFLFHADFVSRHTAITALIEIGDDREEVVRALIGVLEGSHLSARWTVLGEAARESFKPLLTGRFRPGKPDLWEHFKAFSRIRAENLACRERAIYVLSRLCGRARAAIPAIAACAKEADLRDTAEYAIHRLSRPRWLFLWGAEGY